MRIILFTDSCFGCGSTYKEAYSKLEEAENGPPDCRNDEEEFLEPPKPIGMVLTDDDDATVDGYGHVVTNGGAWTISIPLEKDAPPSTNYRFGIMQRLKDEDFENELWAYRSKKYGEEFRAFCKKNPLNDFCNAKECKFNGGRHEIKSCFQAWWTKYKKDKEEKEDSDGIE